MKYRPFGNLDFQVSALGFGCMRLPTSGDNANIDEGQATRMIRHAIDSGVNYMDTAWTYHSGNSERVLGRALREGYRDRVKVATKLPTRLVQTPRDFDRFLNEQLERLQTEHIDFYLLHALRRDRWTKVRDMGVMEWAERAISEGRIGHLGFSFHDDYDAFREIVDSYEHWTLCQIQYNYLNESVQAGTKGLEYAARKGLAVVVMGPLLGGGLVRQPESIVEIWKSARNPRSPVEWALQWVWNKPEVSVVLSGMSAMDQVIENIAVAESSGMNSLSEDELAIVADVRRAYEPLWPIPCTQCGYCMPCPNGVDIPMNFELYNTGIMFDQMGAARIRYKIRLADEAGAEVCIQCRECEDKCPQSIIISEWMTQLTQEFTA